MPADCSHTVESLKISQLEVMLDSPCMVYNVEDADKYLMCPMAEHVMMQLVAELMDVAPPLRRLVPCC